ncbi:hypothetical protein HYPSUDRAFT_72093 [Hypholoma sublateritium FD-334 SS-4]|uniref:Uncharacterized protein n=1 Tax=Hypholoma sublateritium (strain FD-334 SS-4) TaxID=945553 RepID=A0A0D2LWU9_HYPSF|nr:hypothetical protein HYPSUDRAFT_72093 [Hypholoma sublateritium FD-334 SS-4]
MSGTPTDGADKAPPPPAPRARGKKGAQAHRGLSPEPWRVSSNEAGPSRMRGNDDDDSTDSPVSPLGALTSQSDSVSSSTPPTPPESAFSSARTLIGPGMGMGIPLPPLYAAGSIGGGLALPSAVQGGSVQGVEDCMIDRRLLLSANDTYAEGVLPVPRRTEAFEYAPFGSRASHPTSDFRTPVSPSCDDAAFTPSLAPMDPAPMFAPPAAPTVASALPANVTFDFTAPTPRSSPTPTPSSAPPNTLFLTPTTSANRARPRASAPSPPPVGHTTAENVDETMDVQAPAAEPRKVVQRRRVQVAIAAAATAAPAPVAIAPSADGDAPAMTTLTTSEAEGAAQQEPEAEPVPVRRPMVERRRVLRALAAAKDASAPPAVPADTFIYFDASPATAATAAADDDDDSEDSDDDAMSALAPNERRSEEDAALAAELEAAFASDDDDDMGHTSTTHANALFVDADRIAADKAVTEAALSAMRVGHAEREVRKAALARLVMEAARAEAERLDDERAVEEVKEERRGMIGEGMASKTLSSGIETSIDDMVDRAAVARHAAEDARMLAELQAQMQLKKQRAQETHAPAPVQQPAPSATLDADAERAAEDERRAAFEAGLAALGRSQPSTALTPAGALHALQTAAAVSPGTLHHASGTAPPSASAQDTAGLSMLALLAEVESLNAAASAAISIIASSAAPTQAAPTSAYTSLAHAVDEAYIRHAEPVGDAAGVVENEDVAIEDVDTSAAARGVPAWQEFAQRLGEMGVGPSGGGDAQEGDAMDSGDAPEGWQGASWNSSHQGAAGQESWQAAQWNHHQQDPNAQQQYQPQQAQHEPNAEHAPTASTSAPWPSSGYQDAQDAYASNSAQPFDAANMAMESDVPLRAAIEEPAAQFVVEESARAESEQMESVDGVVPRVPAWTEEEEGEIVIADAYTPIAEQSAPPTADSTHIQAHTSAAGNVHSPIDTPVHPAPALRVVDEAALPAREDAEEGEIVDDAHSAAQLTTPTAMHNAGVSPVDALAIPAPAPTPCAIDERGDALAPARGADPADALLLLLLSSSSQPSLPLPPSSGPLLSSPPLPSSPSSSSPNAPSPNAPSGPRASESGAAEVVQPPPTTPPPELVPAAAPRVEEDEQPVADTAAQPDPGPDAPTPLAGADTSDSDSDETQAVHTDPRLCRADADAEADFADQWDDQGVPGAQDGADAGSGVGRSLEAPVAVDVDAEQAARGAAGVQDGEEQEEEEDMEEVAIPSFALDARAEDARAASMSVCDDALDASMHDVHAERRVRWADADEEVDFADEWDEEEVPLPDEVVEAEEDARFVERPAVTEVDAEEQAVVPMVEREEDMEEVPIPAFAPNAPTEDARAEDAPASTSSVSEEMEEVAVPSFALDARAASVSVVEEGDDAQPPSPNAEIVVVVDAPPQPSTNAAHTPPHAPRPAEPKPNPAPVQRPNAPPPQPPLVAPPTPFARGAARTPPPPLLPARPLERRFTQFRDPPAHYASYDALDEFAPSEAPRVCAEEGEGDGGDKVGEMLARLFGGMVLGAEGGRVWVEKVEERVEREVGVVLRPAILRCGASAPVVVHAADTGAAPTVPATADASPTTIPSTPVRTTITLPTPSPSPTTSPSASPSSSPASSPASTPNSSPNPSPTKPTNPRRRPPPPGEVSWTRAQVYLARADRRGAAREEAEEVRKEEEEKRVREAEKVYREALAQFAAAERAKKEKAREAAEAHAALDVEAAKKETARKAQAARAKIEAEHERTADAQRQHRERLHAEARAAGRWPRVPADWVGPHGSAAASLEAEFGPQRAASPAVSESAPGEGQLPTPPGSPLGEGQELPDEADDALGAEAEEGEQEEDTEEGEGEEEEGEEADVWPAMPGGAPSLLDGAPCAWAVVLGVVASTALLGCVFSFRL